MSGVCERCRPVAARLSRPARPVGTVLGLGGVTRREEVRSSSVSPIAGANSQSTIFQRVAANLQDWLKDRNDNRYRTGREFRRPMSFGGVRREGGI